MAERSKRIILSDDIKLKEINKDTVKLFNKYIVDMNIRGLSDKSINGYKYDLNNWFIYVLDNQFNQCVTELNDEDITEFVYYCMQQGNNAKRIKRRMSSISAFYKYLRKKKIIKENPMDYVSRPNKDNEAVVVQTFLSKEQVDTLREKLSGDIQLLTYIMFGLSTMARVNACSNVKWEQVDFENRVVENVREKEGYIVNLYFSEEVKGLLLKLKDFYKENENNCEYVFNTKYGNVYNKVSNTTLNEWCKKAGSLIGVPSLHCHDLRHSGSQLLKLSGCPIEIISELLNHKGLDVTKQFYLRQDKQQMKSEKDKYNI